MHEYERGPRRMHIGWKRCASALALMIGLAGVVGCGDEKKVPLPSPAPAAPSSAWDDMKWDQGVWGA